MTMTSTALAFFYANEVAEICRDPGGLTVEEFGGLDRHDQLEILADHLITKWESAREDGSDDRIEDAAGRLKDFMAVHRPGQGFMIPGGYELVHFDHLGELATLEVCGLD
jgi:hypothetical protein